MTHEVFDSICRGEELVKTGHCWVKSRARGWTQAGAAGLSHRSRGSVMNAHILAADGGTHMRPTNVTEREVAVLRLLAEGHTSGRIARKLGISSRTVEKHLENLYRKLDASNRVAAVVAAQRAGLLGGDR